MTATKDSSGGWVLSLPSDGATPNGEGAQPKTVLGVNALSAFPESTGEPAVRHGTEPSPEQSGGPMAHKALIASTHEPSERLAATEPVEPADDTRGRSDSSSDSAASTEPGAPPTTPRFSHGIRVVETDPTLPVSDRYRHLWSDQ